MTQLEYNLKTILKYGIYAALFTPLVYFSGTFFPFIFGKTLFFRTLIEILFALYLVLIITFPSYRPKRSLVLSAVLIYAGISILATLFSVDPIRSFWSNTERMMGLWTLLHAIGLFIIVGSIFKTNKEWRSFFGVSVWVSMIVGGLGIYQYFSDGFLHAEGGGKVYSTLGNFIYFGGYGLFHAIIATIFLLKEKNKKSFAGAFWLLGIAVGLTSIYFSGTRGVFVAFCGAIVLIIILHAFFYPSTKVRLVFASVLILAVLGGVGLWLNKESSFVKKNYLLSSLLDISFEATTGQTRLINWGVAYESWKQKPILGWGPDTYYIAFNKNYNPKMFEFGSYETWQDHAHNVILDTLNESGILGLISYLSIFLLTFYLILKSVRRKILDFSSGVLLFSLLSAYFVQNLFVFDTLTWLMLFYVVLGFVHFSATRKESDADEHQVSDFVKNLDPIYKQALVGILIFCTFFLVYFTGVAQLRGSMLTIKALKSFNQNFLGSVELLKKATSFNSPYLQEARDESAKLLMMALKSNINLSPEQMKNFLLWAKEGLEKNVEEHPLSVYHWNYLGQWYFIMAQVLKDEFYFEKSKNALDRALELSPKRQQIYFTISRYYLIREEYDNAIEILQQAVDLAPKVGESRWNLGIGYMHAGDVEKAYNEFQLVYQEHKGMSLTNEAEIMMALQACEAMKDTKVAEWLTHK